MFSEHGVENSRLRYVWSQFSLLVLFDMIDKYCERLRQNMVLLEGFERFRDHGSDDPISDALASDIKNILNDVRSLLVDLEMTVSLESLKSVDSSVTFMKVGGVGMGLDAIRTLRDTMINELKSRYFLYVSGEYVDFYKNNQFEQTVIDRFPNSVEDMLSAGQCLALGQETACAFHLMRVIEGALYEVKQRFGIPDYRDSWQQFLNTINAQIKILEKELQDPAKKIHAKSEIDKLSAIASVVLPVKNHWRNDIIHQIDIEIKPDRAKKIFLAVESLMETITEQLKSFLVSLFFCGALLAVPRPVHQTSFRGTRFRLRFCFLVFASSCQTSLASS